MLENRNWLTKGRPFLKKRTSCLGDKLRSKRIHGVVGQVVKALVCGTGIRSSILLQPPEGKEDFLKVDFENLQQHVAIVGSRSFDSKREARQKVLSDISRFVNQLKPGTEVISGCAVGVDSWAEVAAMERLLKFRGFPPNRQIPSPARYFIRNKGIVSYLSSDFIQGCLVAFMDEEAHSGTMHTVRLARNAGVPVLMLWYTPVGKLTKVEHHGDFRFANTETNG